MQRRAVDADGHRVTFAVPAREQLARQRPQQVPLEHAPERARAVHRVKAKLCQQVAGRIIDEHCELPLTPKADVFALALSLLHSIEEPDLDDLSGVEVEAFLQKRMRAAPRGPKAEEHAFLVAPFSRWLAPDPKDRPSAMQLADELAELRRVRAGRGARRAFIAPSDLRTLLVAVAMGTILLTCALLVDSPARPIEVVQGGAAVQLEVAPADETDALRLLRARLDTEERRAIELEEELSRARRSALGLTPNR